MLRLLVPFMILSVVLSACGNTPPTSARGRQSARLVANQTVTDLGKVRYVELSGSISSPSKSKPSSITVTNVVEDRNASTGTVTLVGNPMGTTGARFWGSARFVMSDQITWVNGSDTFWSSLLSTGGANAAQVASLLPKLVGQWIELISASTAVFNSETGGLIDPRGFAQEFLHGSAAKFANRGDVFVNGQHVVELATKTGALAGVKPYGSALPFDIQSVAPSPIVTELRYSYPSSAAIVPPTHFQYLETVLKPYLKQS